MKTLGITLKDLRTLSKFTLRQVEEATGISNAYLSLLENDKIKKPSANVLYKLASIYNVNLNTLLSVAGIIEQTTPEKSRLLNSIAFSAESLSQEEEEALLEYLQFLRSKRK